MFCRKCGNNIPDGSTICPKCGTPTGSANYSTDNTYTPPSTEEPKKAKKKISWKAIVAVLVVLVLVIGIARCSSSKGKSDNNSSPTNTYVKPTNDETNTIMIYMVGSNLESENGAGSSDIKEMCSSGIDFDKNNVIVYAGGSSYWNLDISTGYNSLLQLKEGGFDLVNRTESPVNMGDPATLLDFLNVCYENYKTDNYSLIFWNHGSGPIGGYGNDELFNMDALSIAELYAALNNSPFSNGNKLDWIGFDACLMSSMEIADIMSNFTDYMIASQETEPGCGWNYSFLSEYNRTSDSKEIARRIIDDYTNTIDSYRSDTFNPDVTLSCLDLTKLSETESAMDNLFSNLDSYLDMGGYSTLARGRENSKAFGLTATTDRGNSYDLVDLGSIADNCSDEYGSEVSALKSAIDDMVVYESSNVSSSCGVSIYYPYDNSEIYSVIGDTFCENFEGSTGYSNYIRKFAKMWLDKKNSDTSRAMWKLDAASLVSDDITMQLTNEQLQNYSSASYTILEEVDWEGQKQYIPIVLNCKTAPDKNGKITVSSTQNVYTVNDSAIMVKQLEEDDSGKSFITMNSRVSNGNIRLDALIAILKDIRTTFTVKENSDILINDVILVEDENSLISERGRIEIKDWDNYQYYFNQYIPTYDKNKQMLPYSQWKTSDWSFSNSIGIENNSFEIKPISSKDYSGKLYCQIVVNDCFGNSYGSGIMPLNQDIKTSTVKTDKGEMTFTLYSDYAVLSGYKGKDTRLVIPSTVDGKKVTEIASQALFETEDTNSAVNHGVESIKEVVLPDTIEIIQGSAFETVKNLEKINFPEGLKEIGSDAFFSTSLKEITLPDSLEGIGENAFYGTKIKSVTIPRGVKEISGNPFTYCEELESISVNKKNKSFTVKDNLLLTKDKKTVVCGINVENVEIPKKVETIGRYAFALMKNVKSVTFGKNVKEIKAYSFYDTSLSELTLPDSVERIEYCAFRNDVLGDIFSDEPDVGFSSVNIPENVSFIGEAAFSGQPIKSFTVSESNKYFSADGQFLLSKNGEQLVACGGGIGGKVEVPQGVKEIKYLAFAGCNKPGRKDESTVITELVFPESLVAIKEWMSINDVEKIHIGKNVSIIKDYEYYDFSPEYASSEIIISKENKNFAVKNYKIVKLGDSKSIIPKLDK